MGLREFFRLSRCFIAGMCFWLPGYAQVIHYRLTVHEGDTTGYDVEMRLQHVPHPFRLAMATHHEYDDKFYRFVRNFRVAAADGHATFYLVGNTTIPATVDFDLPAGWSVATGLEPTGDANGFRVASAKQLMDCPVLVGHLWQWHFKEGGVPYRVSYLPVDGRPVFDTAPRPTNFVTMPTCWSAAQDWDKGLPVADIRIYIWQPPGDSLFHLILTSPQSCWGRAGLHTGDGVVAVNGQVLRERAFFYTAIRAAKRGDTITFQLRNGARVVVPVTGYVQARATVSRIEGADAVAQARFREWLAGH